MSVEMLRPANPRLVGAPWSSADSGLRGAPWRSADSGLKGVPLRLLNKGPEYFQRQSVPSCRLSAVERLEADKAKYVKSQQVALTRQAPVIRKALLPPALIVRSPPARQLHSSPTYQVQRHSCRSTGLRRAALDLDVLNDLINGVCEEACSQSGSQSDSCPLSAPTVQSASSSRISVENQPSRGCHLSPVTSGNTHLSSTQRREQSSQATPNTFSCPPTTPPPVSAAVAVAVWHVERQPPAAEERIPQRRVLLAPSDLPPHSPALNPLSNTSSRSSTPIRATLHRSQSDLSDCFSRERFFTSCGMDSEELRVLGAEPEELRRASSLRSLSTSSSEGEELIMDREGAELSEDKEEAELMGDRGGRGGGLMSYGISVVERNARVIKWLYSIRQARGGAVSNM